jgi:hypothetical protein
METLLLQHPLVQFYLLYVGVLFIALIWDHLRHPPAAQDSPPSPRSKAVREVASPSPPRR